MKIPKKRGGQKPPTARQKDMSISEHINPSTEKILRKTTTVEFIERTIQQPYTFDRRSGLHKLPAIISQLRQFGYCDEDPILHDDVVLAIENFCGTDSRTVRKYVRLLIRHDYLKPASMKPNQRVESRSLVTVRTRRNIHIKEYSVPVGYKHYVFGSRAPRSYQAELVRQTPLSTRSDEDSHQAQKNMCVSSSLERMDRQHGSQHGEAALAAIVGEKKEEEVVCHTHICVGAQKLSEREKLLLDLASEKVEEGGEAHR